MIKGAVVVALLCATPVFANDNTHLLTVAAAVQSASRIQAIRFACVDTMGSGVLYVGGGIRALGQPAVVDSAARAQLVTLLRIASRDTADCVDYKCSPCVAYRLDIENDPAPIEMTVTHGCMGWWFKRSGTVLAHAGNCSSLPEKLVEPLQALLRRIYGPLFDAD